MISGFVKVVADFSVLVECDRVPDVLKGRVPPPSGLSSLVDLH